MPDMQAGSGGGTPQFSGAPGFIQDLGSLAQLGGSIYGLVNSSNLTGAANTVFQQSNPFGPYRPQFANQLVNLMQNPDSLTSQPGYKFLMDQGVQAIDRSAAAPGGVGFGSGGEGAELEKYGQGLASSFYNQQVNLLAQLAGAGINPANPAQALQGLGGAAGSVGSSITGLTNSLPGAFNMLSRLFPNSGSTDFMSGIYGGTTPDNMNAVTGTPVSLDNFNTLYGGDPSGGSTVTDQPSGTTTTFDDSGGNIDLTGLFSNPRAAGGEAATGTQPGATLSGFQQLGSLFGIGSGLASGTPTGYASAAVGAANLAGKATGNTNLTGAAGVGTDILGLYQGIKSGGVVGDTEAAVNAAKLGSAAGVLPQAVGNVAGEVAAPLSIYEFAKNWTSGATGSDALSGAESGASIGSLFGGPVGALAGLVVGGAVGAISSVFGPGKEDPENINWNAYAKQYDANPSGVNVATPSQNFQALAGIFDSRGTQIPFYGKFGRMGENKFMSGMTSQINQALDQGKIKATDSPQQIYSTVIAPWINSMGAWPDTYTVQGSPEKGAVQNLLTNLIGEYTSGQSSEWRGVAGQAVNVAPFGSG